MTNRWWPSRGTLDSGSTSAASFTRQRSSGGHMDGEGKPKHIPPMPKPKPVVVMPRVPSGCTSKAAGPRAPVPATTPSFAWQMSYYHSFCILPHQDASLGARCVFDMSLLNPDEKKTAEWHQRELFLDSLFFLFFLFLSVFSLFSCTPFCHGTYHRYQGITWKRRIQNPEVKT